MFHNRTLNDKINRLHERALRLVYKTDKLSFNELLELDNYVTTHQKNLQRLATEMYNVKNKIASLSFQDVFKEQLNPYDIMSGRAWNIPKVSAASQGNI